jgi:rare lipoprotein A
LKSEIGLASYYSDNLQGHPTASGEAYIPSKLTAAHPFIAFGTIVQVINLENGESVNVKINDRGPHKAGRIIDLSKAAAATIGIIEKGIVKVKIQYKE